jgi:N-acetylmuramoyl-L-alanine amidase
VSPITYYLLLITYKKKKMSRYTWILDNGHGGIINGVYQTDGKESPVWKDGSQFREGEGNRGIVNRLAEMLHAANIKYVKLVPQDSDISLQERCVRALAWTKQMPCVLISIHSNYGDGTGRAHGVEVFSTPGRTKSDKVAQAVLDEYRKRDVFIRADTTDGDDDKEANFYIIKNVTCPAILTENFFMDNEEECRSMLMAPSGRSYIAQIHFAAIQRIEAEGLD